MRNTIQTILISMTLLLASCGSSISNDAEKVADLQCEAQELVKKAMSGDESAMEESQALLTKAQTLTNKLQKKYSSVEDREEFQSALAHAMVNCN